ncbi:MAG: family 43 glycosylhydrolase [Bacteroides sp.]|nr:family 43 glycosylhydrolase [Bacteroides sp.]
MNRYKHCLNAAFVCLALMAVSCGDNKEDLPEATDISLSAPVVSETKSSSIKVSATFSDDKGGYAGFCYSVSGNPTIYDASVRGDIVGDRVSATITSLKPLTEYTIKAFVSGKTGPVVYSDPVRFTTDEGTIYDALAAYEPPAYNDYYVRIAGWDSRDRWNLSNVHDPTVMLADDGYYYMYQTNATYGDSHKGHGHFHGRRSKDLVNWEYLGGTLPSLPAWVGEKCNEFRAELGLPAIDVKESNVNFWAPVARSLGNGKYRMYYAIVVVIPIEEGKKGGRTSWEEKAFIGMMETSEPASNVWEDKGYVICSSSDRNKDWFVAGDYSKAYYRYNAVDPTYIITPEGKHWLIYGSWHSGIAALEINPETGKPLNELGKPYGPDAESIASYGTHIYSRDGSRWQGSEGPEVIYRDGYYYLFLAYDAIDVPYNTRVVRSKNVDGPYFGIEGSNLTVRGGEAYPIVTHPYRFGNDKGWVGISHCAVFSDGKGNWYYASQGRLPYFAFGAEADNAIMMGHVRAIKWTSDGWPLVMPERYGNVPQAPIDESELIGKWEHIDLEYNYGSQRESSPMELGADHKVKSGKWVGATWSYNPTRQTLSINGNAELILARECDWEANPRKATIVYAGIGGRVTYWGKKI